jgi:hypothetical protein
MNDEASQQESSGELASFEVSIGRASDRSASSHLSATGGVDYPLEKFPQGDLGPFQPNP